MKKTKVIQNSKKSLTETLQFLERRRIGSDLGLFRPSTSEVDPKRDSAVEMPLAEAQPADTSAGKTPRRNGYSNGLPACEDPFCEPASAPKYLIPKPIGATTSSVRFSSFIDELPIDGIRLGANSDCLVRTNFKPEADPIYQIVTGSRSPIFRLGYMAGHVQKWSIKQSALGELVHSMSLAPGESRNVAMLDWRRRQSGSRSEETTQEEQLSLQADHNRALSEVVQAVAMEQQFGQTMTAANSMASAGAFVAAGAIVGGVAGGVVGTAIEPGLGTLIGAGVGGAAGVAAGGLIVAGANAVGMIMSESSGDRTVISDAHQRINQSTEQQATNVRSIWSTVVVEDSQDEAILARSSNITNYNHMHALNMQYYEVLHEYEVVTKLDRVEPILLLPFASLGQFNSEFVKTYWRTLKSGLPPELQAKGEAVFVSPPPTQPVPPEGQRPVLPADLGEYRLKSFMALLEFPFGPELLDIISTISSPIQDVLSELFQAAELEILRQGEDAVLILGQRKTVLQTLVSAITAWVSGQQPPDPMTFQFDFSDPIDMLNVSGIRVTLRSPFLVNPVEEGLRRLFNDGVDFRYRQLIVQIEGPDGIISDSALRNRTGEMDFIDLNRSQKQFDWNPLAAVKAEKQDEYNKYEISNAPWLAYDAAVIAFENRQAELEAWRDEILAIINSDTARFSKILLNNNPALVSEILDACYLIEGEEAASSSSEASRVPLYRIVDTNPVGFSDRFIVLRMRGLRHLDAIPDESEIERIIHLLMGQFGLTDVQAELAMVVLHPFLLHRRFRDNREDLERSTRVFLPGQGLFAEAVLGVSNAAEYIDMRRFWNWQDSPIPNAAPTLQPVSVQSLAQQPLATDPNTATPTLQPQTVQFPDFQGLSDVLQAVQNGDIFRDMSKAEQLADIIQGLSTLAGDLGKSAATMTGQAASDTLKQAGEIGKTAATLAQNLAQSSGTDKRTNPPATATEKGGAANALTPNVAPESVAQAIRDTFGIDDRSIPTVAPEGDTGPFDLSAATEFAGLFGEDELPENVDFWADVFLHRPSDAIVAELEARDIRIQLFEDAPSVAGLNLDHYTVEITQMPRKADGTDYSASELLSEIRSNFSSLIGSAQIYDNPYAVGLLETKLHLAAMLVSATSFKAYSSDVDLPRWLSDDFLGAVMQFDSPLEDMGVCASKLASDHWIFTTVGDSRLPLFGDVGTHPVSGNRKFGVSNTDGTVTVYTKGADRTSGIPETAIAGLTFLGGHIIWLAWQVGIAKLVTDRGGVASIQRPVTNRYIYSLVKDHFAGTSI